LGFSVSDPIADYDGAGADRVVFSRSLWAAPVGAGVRRVIWRWSRAWSGPTGPA